MCTICFKTDLNALFAVLSTCHNTNTVLDTIGM
jgi:hypothetical protein